VTVSGGGESRSRRPGLIALGFVVVGYLYLTVAGLDSSVTVDDGFYQLPVTSLRAGGEWTFDYVLADVDPDGDAAQWTVGPSENGFFTNVRRPLWVLALVGADLVGGIPGQRLFVLASGAAAVVVAAKLFQQAGSPRRAWVAAALTGASPIAFNSLQFWAHAPTAAVTGMVMWLSLRAMDAERRVPATTFALGVLGAGLAPAIRTDGSIYMLAIALVVGLSGVRRRRVDVAVFGGVVAAAAVVSHLLTSQALTWITGGPVEVSTAPTARALLTRGSTSLGSRIEAFIETFVSGYWEGDLAYVLLLVPLLAMAYAVVLIRRTDYRAASIVIAVAAVAWVVRMVLAPDDFATGLLGAWPVALLVFAEPLAGRTMGEKRILAILGFAFLGVAATQYDVGGGLNWGGRFLSAAIPGLAVLITATLHRLPVRPAFDLLRPAVLGLAAVVTLGSLAADWETRTSHGQQVDVLERAEPEQPVVTSSPALPNLAWRTYPDVQFVWVRDDDHAEVVADVLREAGYESVVGYLLAEEHAQVLTGRSIGTGDVTKPKALQLASAE
jgi:hypothetical protein